MSSYESTLSHWSVTWTSDSHIEKHVIKRGIKGRINNVGGAGADTVGGALPSSRKTKIDTLGIDYGCNTHITYTDFRAR